MTLTLVKKLLNLTLLLVLIFSYNQLHAASGDSYLIDFGYPDKKTTVEVDSWNNVSRDEGTTTISLVKSNGDASSLTLEMGSTITADNDDGTISSSVYPASSTMDSIYISSTGFPNTGDPALDSPNSYDITIGGLQTDHTYDLVFYASRSGSGEVRTADFTAGGQTVSHDGYGNVNNFDTIENISSDVSGNILIEMTLGTGNTNSRDFGYLGVIEITDNGVPGVPPVADAGSNQTITLPDSSVTVSGSGSSDVDGTISTYAWTEITDNEVYIENPSSESTVISDLSLGTTTLQLTVTDDNGDSATTSVDIVVNKSESDSPAKKVVVLGSSTAAGFKLTPISDSWVNLFADYLNELNSSNSVVNLAVSGYNTIDILPVAEGGVSGQNIEEAISENPDGIIINLPSNDARDNILPSDTMDNYARVIELAHAQDIVVWVTTTQPRSGLTNLQKDDLIEVRDLTESEYLYYNIDFWTRIAEGENDGNLVAEYDEGDGTHLTNAGHRILYNRVVGSGFFESLFETNPAFSNIQVSKSENEATITWDTNELSSSKVNYGLTSNHTNFTEEFSTSTRVTSHSVNVAGLNSCTLYSFNVESEDPYFNTATSSKATFITSGCAGSASVEANSEEDIDSTLGGTHSLLEGGKGIELNIPAGFSSTTANFQIKRLEKNSVVNSISGPAGKTLLGSYVYDLKSLDEVDNSIVSFDDDITITISYSDSDITDFDESTLKIYRWDGLSWNALSDCVVDVDANTLTCDTSNFSTFGIYGELSETEDTNTSSSSRSGGTVYGCNDPNANNYDFFTAHKQSLCEYGTMQTNDIQSQIEKLQALVAELQAKIQNNTVSAQQSVSISCDIERDLEIGMEGADVRCLQESLNGLGFVVAETGPGSVGNETDYFGPMTEDAVIRLQEAYAENILTPVGLSSGTGYVGPSTRGFLE